MATIQFGDKTLVIHKGEEVIETLKDTEKILLRDLKFKESIVSITLIVRDSLFYVYLPSRATKYLMQHFGMGEFRTNDPVPPQLVPELIGKLRGKRVSLVIE